MSGDKLLMQGGLPSVAGEFLKNVGDSFKGQLIEVKDEYHSTDDKGEPDYWDEAQKRPKLVIPIELKNVEDNEVYALHVGVGSDLQRAIANAVRKAKCDSPEPGGFLEVTLTGLEEQKDRKKNPKKLHAAVWTPPSSAALMGGSQSTEPASPAEQASEAPASAPAATQPASGGVPADLLSQLTPEMLQLLQQQAAQQGK